jgi:hypothetical protein
VPRATVRPLVRGKGNAKTGGVLQNRGEFKCGAARERGNIGGLLVSATHRDVCSRRLEQAVTGSSYEAHECVGLHVDAQIRIARLAGERMPSDLAM